MSKDSKGKTIEKVLTIVLIVVLTGVLVVGVVWFLQQKKAQNQTPDDSTEEAEITIRDVQTGDIFSQLQDKKYESFSTRMDTLSEENDKNKELVEWREEEITELRSRLTALNQDLITQFENAEALRKEKEALEAELAETQKALEAALSPSDADPEAQNALLSVANQEKEALQKEKDELQADYDAQKEKLAAAEKQLSAAQKQLTALESEAAELKAQAEKADQALTAALAAAETEPGGQDALLTAANEEKEALQKEKEALQQEKDELQADYNAQKEKLAAAEKQLAAAQEQLTALESEAEKLKAQAEKAAQDLTAAQSSADADKTEKDALLTSANEEKEALQKEKEALQQEKDELQADLDAEKEKLTAAEKQLADTKKQLSAMQSAAAELKAQAEKATQALNAAQSTADADKTAQSDLLATANEEKEALQKEKDELQADLDAEKEKLTAAEKQLAAAQERLTALESEAEKLKAQAEKAARDLTAAQSAAEADKTEKDALLTSANEEKEALQQEKDELQADLDAKKEKLAAAEKQLTDTQKQLNAMQIAATELKAQVDKANQALNAAQSSASADKTAQDALLAAANEEKEALQKEKDELQADLDAEKEKLAAAQDELQALADSVDSARQEQAALQQELAQAESANEALANQLSELEQQLNSDQIKEKAENVVLRGLLAKLLAAAYNSREELFSEDGFDPVAVLYENIGLERKAAQAVGLELAADYSDAAAVVNGEVITEEQAEAAVRNAAEGWQLLTELLPQASGGKLSARELLQTMAANLALWQQAETAGLTKLTDQELEDLNAAARQLSAQSGIPAESLLPELTANLIMNKLRDWAGQAVELSEDEYKKALRAKVAENNALYESGRDKFGIALEKDDFVYYVMPDEYRYVKQIFLPVELAALDELNQNISMATRKIADFEYEAALARQEGNTDLARQKSEKMKEWQNKLAEYEAQYAEMEPLVNQQFTAAQEAMADIKAQIKNGTADADALIAQYSADTDMPAKGYAVCDGCTHPFREFVKAALRLNSEGDWGSFLEMDDGYHILYFSEDLSKNKVAIETAKDQLWEEMLSVKRQEVTDAAFEQWIARADIRFIAVLTEE